MDISLEEILNRLKIKDYPPKSPEARAQFIGQVIDALQPGESYLFAYILNITLFQQPKYQGKEKEGKSYRRFCIDNLRQYREENATEFQALLQEMGVQEEMRLLSSGVLNLTKEQAKRIYESRLVTLLDGYMPRSI